MICVGQGCIYQGMDITTTIQAFVSKLDNNMRYLLDNVKMNKRANSVGSIM